MKLSIVIPVFNEQDSVAALFHEIVHVLSSESTYTYEIVFIDDGSTDDTFNVVKNLYEKNSKRVKVVQFRTNFGKAAAYMKGFNLATGDYVITLDGDGQDDPIEIPKVVKKLTEGFDVVVGWKFDRQDSFGKNLASKIFNKILQIVFHTQLHDVNCGIKGFSNEAIKSLDIYGELHRYIPVILSFFGYKVAEIKVNHRKRTYGKSKYSSIRIIHGLFDIFTVVAITKFRLRPLHIFGYIGMLFFFSGFFSAMYLTLLKLIYNTPIGNRPLLTFSVMLMIIGVQIVVTGLIGEYISVTNKSDRYLYSVKEVLIDEK